MRPSWPQWRQNRAVVSRDGTERNGNPVESKGSRDFPAAIRERQDSAGTVLYPVCVIHNGDVRLWMTLTHAAGAPSVQSMRSWNRFRPRIRSAGLGLSGLTKRRQRKKYY